MFLGSIRFNFCGIAHVTLGFIALQKMYINMGMKNFVNKKYPGLIISGYVYDEMLFYDLFHFEQNRITF